MPLQLYKESIQRLPVDAAMRELAFDFVSCRKQRDIDFFEFPADILRQHLRQILRRHLGTLFVFAKALVQRKRHHAEDEQIDQSTLPTIRLTKAEESTAEAGTRVVPSLDIFCLPFVGVIHSDYPFAATQSIWLRPR